MSTATPEPNNHLKPGEINFDLIPKDWALTPLQGKRAYVAGWTTQPYSVEEIKREFDQGKATGVGLITGVWSNEGGLVWVDIDGTASIKDLEELAGAPLSAAFPPTLTISSGKKDRQRMLFSIPAAKLKLLPDKATIKIGIPSFEILFRNRQGAIMGSHPDTEGYFTTPHGGFEYAKNPPEMPEWLYEAIAKAYPLNKYKKPVKTGIVTQQVNLDYEDGSEFQKEEYVNEAKIYLDHLNPERAAEYDDWLKVGMSLKQVDETLLADWIDWSKQADNFQEGVCERKWNTFEVVDGGPAPENHCGLHHLRAMAKEDGYIDVGGFVVETGEKLKEKAKKLFKSNKSDLPMPFVNQVLNEIIGEPSRKEKKDIGERVSNRGRPKTPPASELAEMVTGMVIECGWRYDPKYDTFMFYQSTKGTWRREEYKEEYKHFIQDLFLRESIPTPGGFTSHLLSDVTNLTKAYITQPYWNDDPDKLAFRNGVLEMSTKDFLPHDQENYLTWGLDFDYDPNANSGPIIQWLKKTQYNDEERVQVLRAWLKACLVGKGHELQRFLEVIGPGGRGKSTFANLCCALIGNGNYASTTLNQLEQSRFEIASIKGKRLTLINDSERYGGSAQIFKALTGGDNLRFEEKNKNVGEPFVYTGMVMVCANEPIQTTDNTSGLTRRRLTVEFNRPLWDKNSEAVEMIKIENGQVNGLWKSYLPGLVNWVLEMDTNKMREYLLDTYEKVDHLRTVRNSILLTSNNLVEWLQSEVVHSPESIAAVGKKIPAAKDSKERYVNSNFHLYASYCTYCEDTGSKPVGQKRFISLLLDCCKNQLGLKEISQFSKKGRPFIRGLVIRNSDEKFKSADTILPERKSQQ
jgi:P4 family phage/plasmid primase-like protien